MITALGTTAGFVTLVAGTGGAVLFAQFRAAGIPVDQALAVVSKPDLVAAGAVVLGLFVVLGVIAVAGVYAIDGGGWATTNMRVGLSALVTVELIVVAIWVGEGTWDRLIGIVFCVVLLGVALLAHEKQWLVKPLPSGASPTVTVQRLKPKGVVLAAVAGLATAGLFQALYQDNTPGVEWAASVAVLVSSALAAICFGVASSSGHRYWPYALCVFFSVVVFGAVFTTWRLAEQPKMNPVALLRTNGGQVSGVIGLLVTRRDDRYWLAAATLKCRNGKAQNNGQPQRGRLFSIPRTQVVDDEIGGLIGLDMADNQARALLRELIRRQPGQVPAALRQAKYADALPPAVSPCRVNRREPPAVTLQAGIRVLREADRPRLVLLDASISKGDASHYRWVIDGKPRGAAPFVRLRLKPGRRGVLVATVHVSDRAGARSSVSVKVLAPLATTTLFASDSARVTRAGATRLKALRRRLGPVRAIQRVYVDGHTDDTGSATHNRQLSHRRALAVAQALERLGVLHRTLTARGFGELAPVVSNETVGGRRANRRVEVLIVQAP
ncbi:MAG: hypothetical protein QOC78_289 [Solirubrobacteraceae bacterium]|nr:hypothetical protein [Solirubrobacteraceae bacterium]